MACFTKLIGLSATVVPVILLSLSIYEPTWSIVDGSVMGLDPENVPEPQHVRFQMGLFKNREFIASETRTLYENKQRVQLKLLCILLTCSRGLTVGAVASALVVASFMSIVLLNGAKPSAVPLVAGISSFLSLLSALASGAAVGCWFTLSTRLQEAFHHSSIEGVPELNVPFGQAFTFVAASAASSIVVSVMLFKLVKAKRAELAKAKSDEVLRNDILSKMEVEKKEKERRSIEKEVYSRLGKDHPMASP